MLTPHVFAWQLDELEEKSAEQQALSATMIAELRYATPARRTCSIYRTRAPEPVRP